jgi:hypothetical protein
VGGSDEMSMQALGQEQIGLHLVENLKGVEYVDLTGTETISPP